MTESAFAQKVTSAPASSGSPATARVCNAIIKWTLLALVVLMPLFFLPWTIEVLELNKQLLLLFGAGIAGLAWLGKMLAERKFEYRRSVVNLFVVLYLIVYAASAWMSKSSYMSLIGDFGQEMSGFVTVLAMAILYFVTVNNVRTKSALRFLLSGMVMSGFLVALYGLLQGLGIYVLPFAFAKSASFNTVGTVASLGLYLSFVVTLIGGLLLMGHKQTESGRRKIFICNAFMVATAVLALLLIAVIDFMPINVSLLVASLVLIGFSFVHAKSMKGISGVLLPITALIVSLMLLVANFPLSFGYPAEVMPSMKASMDITSKTLQESPLLGSGPGTFILDYAKYRSPDVNLTAFWNIRFDRASSHFLTSLATTGFLGAFAWLAMVLFLLYSAVRQLLRADENTWHILVSIFAAWFMLAVGKFLYSSTMVMEFMFWMTMGLLVVVHRRDWFSVKFEHSPRAAMMLSFLFILSLVFAVSGLFIEGQRYAAEIHYAGAIRAEQSGADIDDVLRGLAQPADLNRSNDVYLRNLALGLLAKANQQLNEEIDLPREEGESDEEYQLRFQVEAQNRLRAATTLTANSVNTAKRATEINGANIANWSVLASIYQGLMGVTQGADTWAVSSYETAIELEPSNPALYTDLGKVYVYQADIKAQEAAAEGVSEEEAAAMKTEADELLVEASDEFNKAIELKMDYAPAHYHLSLVLDRQGELADAIAGMEAVAALNPQDVGVGFQLSLLYFRNDQKEDAILLMESVIRLSADYSNALWYLASMYEDAGRLDDAIAQIEKVKELNPDVELVAQKLDQLHAKKLEPPAAGSKGLPEPVEQPIANPNVPGVR